MLKKTLIVGVLIAALSFLVSSCKKKEEAVNTEGSVTNAPAPVNMPKVQGSVVPAAPIVQPPPPPPQLLPPPSTLNNFPINVHSPASAPSVMAPNIPPPPPPPSVAVPPTAVPPSPPPTAP